MTQAALTPREIGDGLVCGIAGVVGDVRPADRDFVRTMCEAMRHRGPDASGFHDGPGVCLGMRRLSIIDVAHGQQPAFSEDGRIAAVFNGEIYNFPEIQTQLRARGHTLASESDSECLPHIYEDRGSRFVDVLRGMFAVAIWDASEQVLVLARDRLGKKPLYLQRDGPRLWFASELKCLLARPGLTQEVDLVAVDQYLSYRYVPAPRTIVRGVEKLPPGHLLTWRAGATDVRRYWHLKYPRRSPLSSPLDVGELQEQLRDQLLESTRIRLLSERPLGAFLSGGLDSSAVVAAMARTSSKRISTFSIGFEEEQFNELPYARQVSERYGTDHHEHVVSPRVEDLIPRVVRSLDEPLGDSSAVPSLIVAEMARSDVIVVLNGDGGDESFAGYGRYSTFLRSGGSRKVPAFLAGAGQLIPQLAAASSLVPRRARRIVNAAQRLSAPFPEQRYRRLMSVFMPEEKADLYSPDLMNAMNTSRRLDPIEAAWMGRADLDPINRLMAVDIETYLPGDLLPKVDLTTMAVSLEARSPFLDHVLMEWAAGIPGPLKMTGGETKGLLKGAMEPWLPRDVIYRKKMGFGVPESLWLRSPLRTLVHDTLLAPDSRIGGYLNRDRLRYWVLRNERWHDCGTRVWALLMLELWHREAEPGAVTRV